MLSYSIPIICSLVSVFIEHSLSPFHKFALRKLCNMWWKKLLKFGFVSDNHSLSLLMSNRLIFVITTGATSSVITRFYEIIFFYILR